MNADWVPGGRQPSDQTNRFGLWVCRKIGCYHPQTASPFIIITQLVSWYSLYRPTEGGRPSRPRHCSKGAQPVSKAITIAWYHYIMFCSLNPTNVSSTSQVNDVDKHRLQWASLSVSFLKHYYNFSKTFNVILRSISGTGKVDSVIIFNILGYPKIVKSRLK